MPRTQTPPHIKRKWVKLAGSDFRLRYPQKLIRHVPDCPCHPAPDHWHYEDDKSQQPQRVPVTPTLLEDNGDGTYTQWSFGIFGPVGYKGRLKEGDTVAPLQSRRDSTEALRLERLFDWSLVRQAGMAAVLGGARNPTLIQLAQGARQNFKRRWGSDPT
jgi:hypothetical protein